MYLHTHTQTNKYIYIYICLNNGLELIGNREHISIGDKDEHAFNGCRTSLSYIFLLSVAFVMT